LLSLKDNGVVHKNHVAHAAGQDGKRKTFSLGWMPIGACRGKPCPTHIMASAEYGTFSLVKTQRFDLPDILHNMRRTGLSTTNKSEQATCGARWSIAVHGQLCQTIPLPKGTLTNGFRQF
jgi:hypothetical protein